MRTRATVRGFRLIQGGAVLSEILRAPGPTHSIFDLLAAAVSLESPRRLAVLGWAGGGILAPLRALSVSAVVDAVDNDSRGESLARRICGEWREPLRFHGAEATAWLRAGRRSYDVIVEDLSCRGPAGETKPSVCLGVLPGLVALRIRHGGSAVINLLPVPGVSWRRQIGDVARPWSFGLRVDFLDYENRVLILRDRPIDTRVTARSLRAALREMGSRLADTIRLHTLSPREARPAPRPR